MSNTTGSAPHDFRLLGTRAINRLGFGTMRLAGPGVWGPPDDIPTAIETLRRARDLGINFFDTADSYGPFVVEELLRQALHPYTGLLIATKGGLTRQGPNLWSPVGRPEYLRQCVLMSLRRLGVDRVDLWQLHRIDPAVPRDEQLDAIAQMQKEGIIAMVGLSEVSVDDIEFAQRFFPVATVQNRYNLLYRQSEDVLKLCEHKGIGFIPWFPLGAGELAKEAQSTLSEIAERLRTTSAQVALAWTLMRSKVMIPIPGTSKPQHLEENAAAAFLELSNEDFQRLNQLHGRPN